MRTKVNFFRIAACAVSVLMALAGMAGVRVKDKTDGKPVEGATVISSTGVLLGLTDAEGKLDNMSGRDYPLSIRCLGYEATECPAGTVDIALPRTECQLPEYVVTAGERPVSRMICKVREYTTVATDKDTLIMYCEHMGDIFYARGKVKGFRPTPMFRRLATKHLGRLTNHAEDKPSENLKYSDFEDASWLTLLNIPTADIDMPETSADGGEPDTIPGKHGIRSVIKCVPGMVNWTYDWLADHEGHTWSPFLFKLIGMTVDFDELKNSTAYLGVENGKLTPEQLAYGTFSVKALGRGKWLKKMLHSSEPVTMNGYFEYYPVSIERLTAQEAKELWKSADAPEFMESPNEMPLPPFIARLIEESR